MIEFQIPDISRLKDQRIMPAEPPTILAPSNACLWSIMHNKVPDESVLTIMQRLRNPASSRGLAGR